MVKYHEKYRLQEMEEEGGKQRAFIVVILGVSRDTFCFRGGILSAVISAD